MSSSSRSEYLSLYVKLAMGLTIVVCGVVGYLVERQAGQTQGGDQVFYQTVQLFTLNADADGRNPWLAVGRVVAALLFIWLAYAAIRQIFSESWAGMQLKFFARRHDVVCGLGAAGAALARQVQESNIKRWGWRWRLLRLRPSVVAIESDPGNLAAAQIRARGGVVLFGDATDSSTSYRARVARASRVFVATGSDEANVQIVFDLIESLETGELAGDGRGSPLACYVHVERPGVAGVFGDSVIDAALEKGVDIRVFSAARQSAGELVVSDLAQRRPDATRGERDALYVLLGFGPLGQAAAIEIAQLAHFENARRPAFVIATPDAGKAADRFLAEFGAFAPKLVRERDDLILADVVGHGGAKCDWRCDDLRDARCARQAPNEQRGVRYAATAAFVEAPPHFGEEEFLDMIRRLVDAPEIVPSIVVCLENGRHGFDLAMRLARTLGPTIRREVRLYVWLPKQAGFVAYLQRMEEADRGKRLRIVPFGDCRGTTSLDRIADAPLERLAQGLHADYLARSATKDRRSARPWEKLEPTFRRANFDAARHGMVKLEMAGLRVVPASDAPMRTAQEATLSLDEATIETLARAEHCRWMAERLLEGWRYGPEHSDDRLERPQLVPWEELPDEERSKDRRQVAALLRILNEGETRLVPKRPASEVKDANAPPVSSSLDPASA